MLHHTFEDILKSEEDDVSLTKEMRKIIKDDLKGDIAVPVGRLI